jgi:hypothetical protein
MCSILLTVSSAAVSLWKKGSWFLIEGQTNERDSCWKWQGVAVRVDIHMIDSSG